MRRPSPALVIAFLALLGAWGGPAVAQSLIGSKEIRDDSLRSKDVRDFTLRGRDIRPNSITGRNVQGLTGRDIMRNGLDGSDIDEDTLDAVPNAIRAGSATRADTAGAIDKVTIARISYAQPSGSGSSTLFEGGGIRIHASCSGAGDLAAEVVAAGAGRGIARVHWAHANQTLVTPDNDFGGGDALPLVPAAADGVDGRLTYWSPSGDVVTVQYLAQDSLPAARGFQCALAGTAVHTAP